MKAVPVKATPGGRLLRSSYVIPDSEAQGEEGGLAPALLLME